MFSPKMKRTSVRSLPLLILLRVITLVAAPLVSKAAPPGWWTERGVIDTSQSANDYTAVNQGQLKNIAKAALAEMDNKLPVTPNDSVHVLINSWSQPSSATNDYSAVNLGQLKYVAKQFYLRFQSANLTDRFPWGNSSTLVDDFVAANIGQVKNLFSFDFTLPGAGLDLDHNGLPDYWEIEYFGHTGVDPNADPDNDGFTNLQEYTQGTNPNVADPHVTLTTSSPVVSSSPVTLYASVALYGSVHLTTLTLNGVAQTIQTGAFQLTANLVEGTNTFTLVAVDQQGHTSQASTTVTLDTVAPIVTITQPQDGTSVNASRLDVQGTVADSSGISSVTVNRIVAFVSNGAFTALNVPLVLGANTLTATATDAAENTSSTSMTVTATGDSNGVLDDPVDVQATPQIGFAPVIVMFAVQTPVLAPGIIQEVRYDFVGDHTSYISKPDLTPLSYTYVTPGEYFPVVTIITSVGSFSSYGGYNADGSQPRVMVRVNAPPQVSNTISVQDPIDVVVGQEGNLYVLSRAGSKLIEYDQTGNMVRSLSPLGTAPCGMSVDSGGNVYVAVTGNNQVIRLNPTTSSFTLDMTFNQTGKIGNPDRSSDSSLTAFNAPYDVQVDPANDAIYITDSGNNRIQKYSIGGSFLTTIGTQGSGFGQLSNPKGLRFGNTGQLYIIDSGNNRIVTVDDDEIIEVWSNFGNAFSQPSALSGLDIDSLNIYVVDTGNNRILCFDAGNLESDDTQDDLEALWSLSSEIGLNRPSAVASSKSLTTPLLYVADTGNNRVIAVAMPVGNSPETVWNQMRACIIAKDIDGAMHYFGNEVVDVYRGYFNQCGAAYGSEILADIGEITPVIINDLTAQYRFDYNIGGTTISFSIFFAKENGSWKIQEF